MGKSSTSAPYAGRGPFVAENIPPGSRYELREGHALYCAPTGGDGSSKIVRGAQVLATDPAVKQAGIDAGYSFGAGELRAPDVAVGHVPEEPGWIAGVPPLAVEYASVGQDEKALDQKIKDFLDAGTKWIWVVRLKGPRRVEVYSPNKPMRVYGPGDLLRAPGILKNPVLIEALYEENAAFDATLTNILQRRGYQNLDAVREEAREEGVEKGLQTAILDLCEAFGVDVDDERRRRLASMRKPELEEVRARLKRDRRWD